MSIPKKLRQQVIERANGCCEYCRIGQDDRLLSFHVDHIIPHKHRGADDELDNLCLACYRCNAYKSSNIATFDPQTGNITGLFHPRKQKWEDHFRLLDNGEIEGITPEGRGTIFLLRVNDQNRVQNRLDLIALGRYPCR
ncbi:MAG: HNH endonuclease signature motif containing protein [bacterium]|nr:HNH endonuclease signature motif containing protein [bacterium]